MEAKRRPVPGRDRRKASQNRDCGHEPMSSGIPGRTTGAVSSDIARLQRDHDLQEKNCSDAGGRGPGAIGTAFERSSEIRTYMHLVDNALPGRAASSSGTPRPRKAPNIVARKRQFVEQFQADLGHPVSREKIYPLSLTPKSVAISALSRPGKRGGSRVVTNAGRDAVDASSVRRGRCSQGELTS